MYPIFIVNHLILIIINLKTRWFEKVFAKIDLLGIEIFIIWINVVGFYSIIIYYNEDLFVLLRYWNLDEILYYS